MIFESVSFCGGRAVSPLFAAARRWYFVRFVSIVTKCEQFSCQLRKNYRKKSKKSFVCVVNRYEPLFLKKEEKKWYNSDVSLETEP